MNSLLQTQIITSIKELNKDLNKNTTILEEILTTLKEQKEQQHEDHRTILTAEHFKALSQYKTSYKTQRLHDFLIKTLKKNN